MAQGPGAARTGFERIRVLDLGWVWAGADEPDPERSGLYLYLNTNKLGITMATGSPEAGDLLNRLASQVDLLGGGGYQS